MQTWTLSLRNSAGSEFGTQWIIWNFPLASEEDGVLLSVLYLNRLKISKHCRTYWFPPGSCQIHVTLQVLYGLRKNPINQIRMTWKAELWWTLGQTGTEIQASVKSETKQILPGFFWGSWILKRPIALPVFIMKLALTSLFTKASLFEMKWPCENLIFYLKESRSFLSLWFWQESWMYAQAHQQFKAKGDSRDSSMHGNILNSQF